MELYFVCPTAGSAFRSSEYFLEKGYQIVEHGKEGKKLQGVVKLKSGCPICGQDHHFKTSDVLCSLSGGKSES